MVSNGAGGKLRVLVVTRNFPPLLGGMEKFNARLFAEMAREFDVALCGPAGCAEHVPANTEVSEVGGGNLAVFLARLAIAALRMARRFRPDVVVAGSGLTGPLALAAARSVRARYVVFVYGLDLVVNSRIYQRFWMPTIRSADLSFPISEYTRRIAIERGLPASKMMLLTPGVDMPTLDPGASARFRQRFGLAQRPILLSVGRLTNRKGVVEFIEKSLPSIVAAHPDVAFVIIGGEPADALAGNRGGAMDRIRQAAERSGIARNVFLLGRCEDDVVLEAYQASQVHVFPVIELPGDVEGFGLVALEAAAGGLPTVAFRVGGIPDAIGEDVSGTLVTPADYVAMSAAVCRYLDRAGDGSSMRHSCIGFARLFDWRIIGQRLIDALKSCVRTRTTGIAMADDEEQFSRIKQFYDDEYYGSSNRDHGLPWHYRVVADRMGNLDGLKVLDVACGVGDWLALMRSRGSEVHGIDISEQAIERCKERLPGGDFRMGPAENLPFDDASFDLVTCLGSLEHFVQPERALREMLRVARPGARFLLLVPNAGFLPRRLGLYGGTHQVKVREVVRSLDEWSALFTQAGLGIEKRWRDLHVLTFEWIGLAGPLGWIPRALQAVMLPIWPMEWQYQVYHLCHRRAQ